MQSSSRARLWIVVAVFLLPLAVGCGAQPDETHAPPAATSSEGGAPGAFTWPDGTPGRLVDADELTQIAAGEKVDLEDVREVVESGSGAGELILLAARQASASGTVCFGVRMGLVMTEFQCLPEAARGALVVRDVVGGSEPGALEWSKIVGVARNDVHDVVVVRQSGDTARLELNRWRGFGYSQSPVHDPVVGLRAFGADGALLDEVTIAPSDAPCPSGEPGDC